MHRKTENGYICLNAEKGKRMYNGEIYATKVYIKNETSVSNWYETDDVEDITAGSQEITAEEALSIITRGDEV